MPHRPAAREPLPSGPFSIAHARALGYSESAVRHAVARGRWERLRTGAYRVRHEPSVTPHEARRRALVDAAAAAVLTHGAAVISHAAAAALHGLPLHRIGPTPCVTVSTARPLHISRSAHLHRAGLPDGHVASIGDYRVTSAARTVADIARELGVDAAVVVADAALHRALVDADALTTAVQFQRGWPGSRLAGKAVQLASPGSESPLETLSRLRIVDAGLPAPALQQELGDDFGYFIGRVDFYWDEFGVIGEADGDLKYDTMSAVIAEKERQSRLLESGLQVVRWGWDDLSRFEDDLSRFELVAARLRSAFRRGAGRRAGRGWSVLNDPREHPRT